MKCCEFQTHNSIDRNNQIDIASNHSTLRCVTSAPHQPKYGGSVAILSPKQLCVIEKRAQHLKVSKPQGESIMLRHILIASVGAVALAGSAFAADLPSRAPPPIYLPPAPIFTWTGIYIGGQIGYAWGNQNTSFGDAFGDFGQFGSNAQGVIGGAHVGYNLQLSQFVIGLEGSVDGTSLKKSFTSNGEFFGAGLPGSVNINVNSGIQGSIRGRVGYAWDRVLLYATGGVAFAGVDGSVQTNFGDGFGGFDSASSTRVGWTVGGGLEYAVTNNWSIRAEYRYSDFGHTTFFANNSFNDPAFGGAGAFVNRHFVENQVQVGFSYKFDTFAPPVPVVAKY
jgi:outer membrane immunogenic protein